MNSHQGIFNLCQHTPVLNGQYAYNVRWSRLHKNGIVGPCIDKFGFLAYNAVYVMVNFVHTSFWNVGGVLFYRLYSAT